MIQSFKLALRSIWSNKVRSLLTMLGIIIGVASVIILVSLVNGYMSYMMSSFASMGANQINIRLTNLSSRYATVEQMYEFYDAHPEIFSQMTPQVTVSASVKYGGDTMDSTSVTGVSEQYLDMIDDDLTAGRFLSYSDISARQKVAVLGYHTATSLFGSTAQAVGQRILISGYGYTVIGVVERQTKEGQKLEDGGDDDKVYIPYTTAVRIARSGIPSNYIFATVDTRAETTDTATELLKEFLKGIYKSENLYRITAMSSMLDSMNEMIAQMSLLLGGIAGISLLVAGVGVMNIMLVSVTERTREIGIRKALGARPGVILQQFVLEAIVTSVLGGIIGIGLGSGVCSLVSQFVDFDAPPTFSAIAVSFSVSVMIGLIFGYMPARRAASLNPIDALRSE